MANNQECALGPLTQNLVAEKSLCSLFPLNASFFARPASIFGRLCGYWNACDMQKLVEQRGPQATGTKQLRIKRLWRLVAKEREASARWIWKRIELKLWKPCDWRENSWMWERAAIVRSSYSSHYCPWGENATFMSIDSVIWPCLNQWELIGFPRKKLSCKHIWKDSASEASQN